MKYKGQKGQDQWVAEQVFPNKKNGYFLDLAAANGVRHSNTYTLEKEYGWNGLAIEPNPIFYKNLSLSRNCTISNCAISSQHEKALFRIDNGGLGGIVAEDTDNSYKARSEQLRSERCEIIALDALPLVDVLQKHNVPPEIDYWSLDVEGAEERIISSFDFSKYSFGCITIERPTPKCNQVLQDNGYIFVKNYKFDSFYVHPKNLGDIKPLPFEQIPPKDW